jgi:DNA-binding XRE family transcriptional regulator
MDKRFKPLSLSEQLRIRQQVVEDILNNPQWPLQQVVQHLKTSLRLTTAELAKVAGISARTLQDIEQGRSQGTVQTMNKILGVMGLRLGVCKQ